MGRRPEEIEVRITHSCDPDPGARERAIQMWAAFLAENRRRQSRGPRKVKASDHVG